MSEIKEKQNLDLLKELHILTRDGKMNQDSRRKLKQVYHLYHFIEDILLKLKKNNSTLNMVDHGAGKSYLGFIVYDLFYRHLESSDLNRSSIYGIETRSELIKKSEELKKKFQYHQMHFLNLSVQDSFSSSLIPKTVDLVTALHACDTATDDAIKFALMRESKYIVLVPCCQAEVASILRFKKGESLKMPLIELWRHPIHTREMGSHLTNVLRCLQLESFGYKVTVTELIGFEHSMKNELIIAEYTGEINRKSKERVLEILNSFNLDLLQNRFFLEKTW